ncbi:hypothetical protein RSOLAG22IIIB_11973 [Rhizoctonia solani]|uniref:Uncharacterized protein n=1 Tax=Rhizoctonia solani TaxID=456999 RepID=A0A0K6GAV6_9AGAM|nr:hypothetical protein RSOLAG22IIIB_11973 [Rhizoctonia solani]
MQLIKTSAIIVVCAYMGVAVKASPPTTAARTTGYTGPRIDLVPKPNTNGRCERGTWLYKTQYCLPTQPYRFFKSITWRTPKGIKCPRRSYWYGVGQFCAPKTFRDVDYLGNCPFGYGWRASFRVCEAAGHT